MVEKSQLGVLITFGALPSTAAVTFGAISLATIWRHLVVVAIPPNDLCKVSGTRWRREMAIESSILVCKIPRTRLLVSYSPWGLKELDTN